MPCDHAGGPELIEMAETYLHRSGIPSSNWNGRRFRWSENLTASMWASVVVEIERIDGQWIVTRLDRNQEPVEETGFAEIHVSS